MTTSSWWDGLVPFRPAAHLARGAVASTAAVAAFAAVAVAPVSAPVPPPVSVAVSNVATAPVAIGSYNIRAGVSTDTFRNAVRAVMPITDLVGLQEVNSHAKEDVLRSMSDLGWSYYRGKPGEQSPIMWNASRFSFVSGRVSQIAAYHYIGNELPNVDHVNPMYATVVRLSDRVTGVNVVAINIHLVPGAVINGGATPGRPRLFAAYKESVGNLAALTKAERGYGRTFVLGDFNVGWVADQRVHLYRLPYATFLRQWVRSMWATERPSGGVGSHVGSPSLIDQVYSTGRATTARVRYSVTYSDHFPVVATYSLSSG